MRNMINKMTKAGCLGIAVGVFILDPTWALAEGTVKGIVSDRTSHGFLPGAVVSLKGTRYRAVTGNDGRYRFEDVPPGNYKLVVSYIGYDSYEVDIAVADDDSTILKSIALNHSYDTLEEVIVQGARFGHSKSLNDRKEAVNIKNIVSEEMIKSFPDLNTAEVLQRVSGVSIQRSNGEGRFVALRGTAPRFTRVTINGQQAAFSNGENRSVELDVVSAAQLSGIEVTKVVTPDMDANAIGGTVNLITRGAFDSDGMVLKVNAGGGGNTNASGTNARFSASYSDIFGSNENIGVSLAGNFARTNTRSDSNEARWGDRDDVNDNVIPLALREITVKSSKNVRDRYGLNGRIDYNINEDYHIFLSGAYNLRNDSQERQEARYRFDKGDYLSPNEVEGARVVTGTNERLEKQIISTFILGGDFQFGESKLDVTLSRSDASTKKDGGQVKPEFQRKKVNFLLENIDTFTPGFMVTNGVDLNDGGEKFDKLDLKFENTTSQVNEAAVNFTTPLVLGSDTGTFKFGGKYRQLKKDRGDIRTTVEWNGADDLLYSQFTSGDDLVLGNGYNIGPAFDHRGFRDFFNANQDPATGFSSQGRNDVNFGEPYDATEDVSSIYGMVTQEYGSLLVVAGVRAEFTSLDYTASNLVLDNKVFVSNTQENVKRSYTHIFPNLQFRYRIGENTNIRLAYSKGLAMPNFFDAMPYSIADLDDERITKGNAGLNPAISNNLDLLGEHFFEGIGVLSGGGFYKSITDFSFLSRFDQDFIDSAGVNHGLFDFRQVRNGASAKLFGFEFTWQQQFTFLSGWMSGFGIFANYTYTHVSSLDLGGQSSRTDVNVLPEQMENVGNLALTYEKYGITSKLAWNYSGKWLRELGETASEDIWRDTLKTLDFSASYMFENGMNIYFQANNITNSRQFDYFGERTRSREYEVTGRTLSVGAGWSF